MDVEILCKTGRKNQTLPLKKIDLEHSKLNKIESKLFSERLLRIIESEKSISIRNHLKCFDDYGKLLKDKQKQDRRKEQKVEEMLKTHNRLMKMNQLKRYLQFKTAWENNSKRDWLANLEIRKENLNIQKKIERKKQKKKMEKIIAVKNETRDKTFQDIHHFEKRVTHMKQIGFQDSTGNRL